ncbi:uroporphyrinogen-III C-methyltransferase [Bacillus sp. FJAT-45350]|uniref:uroporphyrinogen-III C-methyltransferase n=1 Tax=Bacillus sp. FJAT-45350 TaxID=2011014 RepID=UPI000BB9955A|nr:uroporphyrinogen-III C-methyltransferase [Bacillus sp. FJAT-45350]
MKGIVYLVGAGPGDPKLITLRGKECIEAADVIVYDRLANEELLQYAKQDAQYIYCGKLPKSHTLRQEQINELLGQKAMEGLVVTRLKGGDPCVFGRVGEEASHLAKLGVKFEVIPGITAGIAAPAYAGIPVTHREHGSSFAMVTGHLKENDFSEQKWQAFATGIDTIAFYMGMKNLPRICEKLISHGRPNETPVAVIEWGTTCEQRTVTGTLQTIVKETTKQRISHPAIILVGEVVNVRKQMNWFEAEFVKN